jgi:hypothetical protein
LVAVHVTSLALCSLLGGAILSGAADKSSMIFLPAQVAILLGDLDFRRRAAGR